MSGVQKAVAKAQGDDAGMPSMVEMMPKPWPTPPTYFKLNSFTAAYQVRACQSTVIDEDTWLNTGKNHRIISFRVKVLGA